MYRIIYTLDKKTFSDRTVCDFLEDRFRPKTMMSQFTTSNRDLEALDKWGKDFQVHLPRTRADRFLYICFNTEYTYGNYTDRACQKFVWPEFFKLFPKGKILLLDLDSQWFDTIWRGQFEYAREIGWDEQKENLNSPQDMSGLKSDNLPFSALQIAQFGIYPLTLFDFWHIFANLTCIYVPSHALRHSQMSDPGLFGHLLSRLRHIFDDQWTFDGRGPKYPAGADDTKPTECLEYLSWVIQTVGARMADLLRIEDVLQREQLAMTFNRAACDGILAVATQLPYMSKTFFFGCLDKLANIMIQIGRFKDETSAWQHIISRQFLMGDLLSFIRSLPATPTNHFASIIETVCDTLKVNHLTPQLLRDFRNSLHGYKLRKDAVERLFKHSGEIDNDITLLATPLLLYTLSVPWSFTREGRS